MCGFTLAVGRACASTGESIGADGSHWPHHFGYQRLLRRPVAALAASGHFVVSGQQQKKSRDDTVTKRTRDWWSCRQNGHKANGAGTKSLGSQAPMESGPATSSADSGGRSQIFGGRHARRPSSRVSAVCVSRGPTSITRQSGSCGKAKTKKQVDDRRPRAG